MPAARLKNFPERLAEEVVVLVIKTSEIILRTAVSTEGSAISEFLDVVQTAGNTAIAVAVESVKTHRCPADDAGVQLGSIQDGLQMLLIRKQERNVW